jgi:hypothetical protein
LPIGQVFSELENGDEGESPWRYFGLALMRVEVGEVRVVEEGAKGIA